MRLRLDLESPNFFSLRATLTPPLSPKGQAHHTNILKLKMKYTKNIYWSKLTDEHLKSLLIISTVNLIHNCKQLSLESYSYINLINHNYNV
jgi:hypothetical protein